MGFKSHACMGGTSVKDDINKLKDIVHIVAGTPGRMHDMIKKGFIKIDRLRILIIDEVDEILGRGFLD
jgi:translation initiation factor 4A